MREEYELQGNDGLYDPLEDPWYVHGPIMLSIFSILLDRLIAVSLWSYESNPVVMQLGIYRWVGLSIILIFGILYAWYTAEGVSNSVVRVLVYGIAVAHLSMVVLNISVVILS